MEFHFEQHPQEESFELYALGRLDDANTELFEQHLLICEHCRVQLDAADEYVKAMQSASARLRRESGPSRATGAMWNWLRLPAAGWVTAALAACAFLAVSIQLPHPSPGPDVISVPLFAERGEAVSAPAHRRLDLELDVRGLDLGPRARAELVNAQGETLETSTVSKLGDKIQLHTTKDLNAGAYFVRLYPPNSRDVAREFGLDLK
jgi:hypothetical protein